MYYFGYGSNLRASFVSELLPSARYVMKASLPNYEVQWREWSPEFGGGISSICETPGEVVQGVLYECAQKELEKLDYIPGIYVPKYKRESFIVLGEDGHWHSAELYRLRELKGPYPPSKKYVEGMLEGARQMKLSPDYLEKIETWLQQSVEA